MEVWQLWGEFKTTLSTKKLTLQCEEKPRLYRLWAIESQVLYRADIIKEGGADQTDFEDNYKATVNQSIAPVDSDGKGYVRAESRPLNTTTCFLGRADSETEIGKGKKLFWDFTNDEDLISLPSGSTEKRKRIEFKFLDTVSIKEGAIYYHNVPKGTYLDLYIVCPAGYYYLNNTGTPCLATEDTPVHHYVINHFLQGTVAMGDELNTESCSDQEPSYYKYRLEITAPDTDEISNGFIELEIYRKRTIIL